MGSNLGQRHTISGVGEKGNTLRMRAVSLARGENGRATFPAWPDVTGKPITRPVTSVGQYVGGGERASSGIDSSCNGLLPGFRLGGGALGDGGAAGGRSVGQATAGERIG